MIAIFLLQGSALPAQDGRILHQHLVRHERLARKVPLQGSGVSLPARQTVALTQWVGRLPRDIYFSRGELEPIATRCQSDYEEER